MPRNRERVMTGKASDVKIPWWPLGHLLVKVRLVKVALLLLHNEGNVFALRSLT